MQTFKDSVTGQVWSLDDDVIVESAESGLHFFRNNGTLDQPEKGEQLTAVPPTLQPYTVPAPTSSELLAAAQLAQASLIDAAYAAAITADISFTPGAGATQTFQADPDSQDVLLKAVIGYGAAGAVPPGFFWKAADNMLVPFTPDDVRGLYAAMLSRGWAAFQARAAKKQAIATAPTVAAVQAITWSPLP